MRKLGLALVDDTNEFQQLLAGEAAAAAKQAGFALEVRASGVGGYELGAQLRLIDAWLDEQDAPFGLLVLAARDRGLKRVVAEAAQRGVHWIGLNRTEDDLDAIRRIYPGVVIATVCPDEKETGRIQAQIVRMLLPRGARVLYVTGHSRSLTARDRAEGFLEGVAGHCDTLTLEAGWMVPEAVGAIASWLRIALRARRRVDAIVCQTDALAEGALRALAEVGPALGRPDLSQMPVVGCDGTPGFGQTLVAQGRLTATVVLPRTAATAVNLLSAALERGSPVPSFSSLGGWAWPESLVPLPASA